YKADAIPSVSRDGAQINVIIGDAYGVESPVRSESKTLYVELKLDADTALALPEAEELAAFVVSGDVDIEGARVEPGHLAVLEPGDATLHSATESHIMLVGGDRLEGERIVWWNFVSSSRERLEKAKDDWRSGRFDMVPGETDFIPLPDT
ncbi:MAG: hypothetical protein KJO82_03575, partial [Gammaproteobacteria bacterium]|nr:hypothetical protein [Gammaproteobacteria bacterium]